MNRFVSFRLIVCALCMPRVKVFGLGGKRLYRLSSAETITSNTELFQFQFQCNELKNKDEFFSFTLSYNS